MEYEAPEVMMYKIQPEGFICQSPGGGGSEGTGDEPLFIAPQFDDLLF